MTFDRDFLCAVVDFGTGPTFVCGRLEDGGRWGDSHWIREPRALAQSAADLRASFAWDTEPFVGERGPAYTARNFFI